MLAERENLNFIKSISYKGIKVTCYTCKDAKVDVAAGVKRALIDIANNNPAVLKAAAIR